MPTSNNPKILTNMKRYSLYLTAFLAMITSAMSADTAKKPDAIQVEVLIFSGRPNPVFTITDPAEINEIMSLANNLPSPAVGAANQKAAAPALGYRGIAVENLSTTLPDVQAFTVHRGHVQLHRKQNPQAKPAASDPASSGQATSTDARNDGSAALETRLLNLAHTRGAIDDRVFDHINRTK